jgi:hypothetical protein
MAQAPDALAEWASVITLALWLILVPGTAIHISHLVGTSLKSAILVSIVLYVPTVWSLLVFLTFVNSCASGLFFPLPDTRGLGNC